MPKASAKRSPESFPYTLMFYLYYSMKRARRSSYTQSICEVSSQAYCEVLQPMLALMLYAFLFFVIHEVFRPSGKFPVVPTVEVRVKDISGGSVGHENPL